MIHQYPHTVLAVAVVAALIFIPPAISSPFTTSTPSLDHLQRQSSLSSDGLISFSPADSSSNDVQLGKGTIRVNSTLQSASTHIPVDSGITVARRAIAASVTESGGTIVELSRAIQQCELEALQLSGRPMVLQWAYSESDPDVDFVAGDGNVEVDFDRAVSGGIAVPVSAFTDLLASTSTPTPQQPHVLVDDRDMEGIRRTQSLSSPPPLPIPSSSSSSSTFSAYSRRMSRASFDNNATVLSKGLADVSLQSTAVFTPIAATSVSSSDT